MKETPTKISDLSLAQQMIITHGIIQSALATKLTNWQIRQLLIELANSETNLLARSVSDETNQLRRDIGEAITPKD